MSSLKRSGNNYGTLNSSESHTSFQRGTRTSRVSIIIQYKYSGTPYRGHAWMKDTSLQGTLFLSHFDTLVC